MSSAEAVVLPINSVPSAFSFEQKHGAFFKLCLKTLLLSVVTLGIYSFWGRVAITKYLYSHTTFGKQSFDYHATGKEMFIGFLKGIGILAGAVLVVMIIMKLFPQVQIPLGVLIYLAAIFLLAPYLLIGKWRFMLSRSSYCNVRFNSSAEYKEFRGTWIKGVFLSIITLGLYTPVLQNTIQKYLTDKSRFGTLKFGYSGKGGEFFRMVIIGMLLSVCTLGIYSFWLAAKVNKYVLSHTTLDGKAFNSTMTGGGLFVVSLVNMLIVIFTLTLGFPIAINRMYGYFFANITLEASPGDIATAAAAMDPGASALATGIEEAANIVDALSGVI